MSVISQEELERQYNKGYKEQDFTDFFIKDTDELKQEVLSCVEHLSQIDIKEYILYKKWEELRSKYKIEDTKQKSLSLFFDSEDDAFSQNLRDVRFVKNKIGTPNNSGDYKNLKPRLINTTLDERVYGEITNTRVWKIARELISTMIYNPTIGKNIFYLVIDDDTRTLLGIIQICGDYMDLKSRDEGIGGTREDKAYSGKLEHSLVGSTIVPTQPFGYNYLGGKLLALLAASDKVERDYQHLYGKQAVNITTTSLYGSFSQYNSLKYWRKLGRSKGQMSIEPYKHLEFEMRKGLGYHYPFVYFQFYRAVRQNGQKLKRLHRQRSLNYVYSKLGIPREKTISKHERGVYHCPLFTNTAEFLRGEVSEEKLEKRFDNSCESLIELGRSKYAEKRIKKLLEKGIDSKEKLFYDSIIDKTGEEVKHGTLKNVKD